MRDGRHRTAAEGQAEVRRRHGVTPAARAREALRGLESELPLLPPARGYLDVPWGKAREAVRRDSHARYDLR